VPLERVRDARASTTGIDEVALVIEKGVVGSSAVKRVAYLMGVDEWSVLGRLTALWEASQELDKCVASGDEIGFWVGAKSREESAQWAAALADPLAGFMRAREDGTFEIRGNKKHIEKVRAVKDANRERVMKRWRKGTENTAGTTITPPNDTAGIPPVQKSDTAPIPELNQAKPSQAELNQANKKQKRAPGAQEPSDAALGSSDGQSPISLTWKAYRDAYERRHRAAPPWNAKHAGQIAQFVKDNAWGHHASCTNRMGKPDDPNAVVDSNFRVIGTQNLRIVDASIFPRIPGFFIVTPIYMIAEKASEVILRDAGKTLPAVV